MESWKKYPHKNRKRLEIVTASDGSHAIALIKSVQILKQKMELEYPEFGEDINNISVIVYFPKNIHPYKREKFFDLAGDMQVVVHDCDNLKKAKAQAKGYCALVKAGRMKGKDSNFSREAVYVDQCSERIMAGNASAGVEIAKSLMPIVRSIRRKSISGSKVKVALILPLGKGELLGAVAGLKSRISAKAVAVQTKPLSAFLRNLIMHSQKEKNIPGVPTAVVNGRNIIEDGFNVDVPSKFAMRLAREILDAGVIVDPKKSLMKAARLLNKDLRPYLKKDGNTVCGTGAATLEALMEYPHFKIIEEADIIVLLIPEIVYDPAVVKYISTFKDPSDSETKGDSHGNREEKTEKTVSNKKTVSEDANYLGCNKKTVSEDANYLGCNVLSGNAQLAFNLLQNKDLSNFDINFSDLTRTEDGKWLTPDEEIIFLRLLMKYTLKIQSMNAELLESYVKVIVSLLREQALDSIADILEKLPVVCGPPVDVLFAEFEKETGRKLTGANDGTRAIIPSKTLKSFEGLILTIFHEMHSIETGAEHVDNEKFAQNILKSILSSTFENPALKSPALSFILSKYDIRPDIDQKEVRALSRTNPHRH